MYYQHEEEGKFGKPPVGDKDYEDPNNPFV
jgi:hypothetical protein